VGNTFKIGQVHFVFLQEDVVSFIPILKAILLLLYVSFFQLLTQALYLFGDDKMQFLLHLIFKDDLIDQYSLYHNKREYTEFLCIKIVD